jgi:immune inhibitor A
MQPENGGLGVFAHEFGHDLGLPDLYDTSGNGENGTGFWSLMSSGSWLGRGDGAIGGLPNDFGPWEKLQLGWLDYDTAQAAASSLHRLGPSALQYPEGQRRRARQGLVVELPEKTVTTEIHPPAQGEAQWWSGMGDELSNTLTRTVDLTSAPAGGSASLDLTGWWSIEKDYDYLYAEASTDGGETWTSLDGTAGGEPIPRDGADRPALTGESSGDVALSYPLDAYVGESIELRFRYVTDGSTTQTGFTADEIAVTAGGEVVVSDDAESGDAGWTAEGFSRVGASITGDHPQFYIVENRQYVGYDETLEVGPYNFGWETDRPKWVEHYPYQNGMLVWYWDTSQADNNISQHEGEGLILPVDAHADPDRWTDGALVRNRIQSRDATFGWRPTPRVTLHDEGEPAALASRPGAPFFDDSGGTYWDPTNPRNSVRVPETGTRITILHQPVDETRPMTVLVSEAGGQGER